MNLKKMIRKRMAILMVLLFSSCNFNKSNDPADKYIKKPIYDWLESKIKYKKNKGTFLEYLSIKISKTKLINQLKEKDFCRSYTSTIKIEVVKDHYHQNVNEIGYPNERFNLIYPKKTNLERAISELNKKQEYLRKEYDKKREVERQNYIKKKLDESSSDFETSLLNIKNSYCTSFEDPQKGIDCFQDTSPEMKNILKEKLKNEALSDFNSGNTYKKFYNPLDMYPDFSIEKHFKKITKGEVYLNEDIKFEICRNKKHYKKWDLLGKVIVKKE